MEFCSVLLFVSLPTGRILDLYGDSLRGWREEESGIYRFQISEMRNAKLLLHFFSVWRIDAKAKESLSGCVIIDIWVWLKTCPNQTFNLPSLYFVSLFHPWHTVWAHGEVAWASDETFKYSYCYHLEGDCLPSRSQKRASRGLPMSPAARDTRTFS